MKTMNGIFGVVVVLILLFSVAPATLGFMAFEHQDLFVHNILIRHIDKEQWQIGYRFATTCPAEFREKENELKELITASLHAWLQPLREEFPAAVITNKFNLILLKDVKMGETDEQVLALSRQVLKELNTRITFTCEEGMSSIGLGRGAPDVFMRGSLIDETMKGQLVHELGHAFGMGDTYVDPHNREATRSTGGRHQTRGLQPSSVMNSWGVHPPREMPYITEDAKKGIIWLYKHVYEGQPLNDCFFPEYVFQEDPAGCIPKHPLIFEVKYGNPFLTNIFLRQDRTVDVNEQDENGLTALHYGVLNYAVLNGLTAPPQQFFGGFHEYGFFSLLLARADINPLLLDKQGRSPVGLAWERAGGDMVEWTKRFGDIDWWLTAITRILEQDPPVDISAQDAQILLESALILNRPELVKGLLAHPGSDVSLLAHPKLDVNAQYANGQTLLHHAVVLNRPELVKGLLAHKDIKPYISNEAGDTPLVLAHKLGLTSIVKLLTDHPRAFMAVEPRQKTMAVTWGELKRGN